MARRSRAELATEDGSAFPARDDGWGLRSGQSLDLGPDNVQWRWGVLRFVPYVSLQLPWGGNLRWVDQILLLVGNSICPHLLGGIVRQEVGFMH